MERVDFLGSARMSRRKADLEKAKAHEGVLHALSFFLQRRGRLLCWLPQKSLLQIEFPEN